jgi:hypothetical protein
MADFKTLKHFSQFQKRTLLSSFFPIQKHPYHVVTKSP